MKILHVTHGYFPESTGGVEAYLRMTMQAQQAAGEEVMLLTGSMELWDDCGIEELVLDAIPVRRLHRDDWYFDHYARSYHARSSELIEDLLRSEKPDLVHLHQWIRLSADIVGIANRLGIPTVVTLHDVYTSCPRAFRVHRDGLPCFRELSPASCRDCVPRFGHERAQEIDLGIELFRDQYRAEIEAADRVLVGMDVTADLLSRTTGIPRERFTVHQLPYRRRFNGVSEKVEVFRFGYWGSLTRHKGPHVLIDAFRKAVAQVATPLELHVFGPMPTEDAAAELWDRATGIPVLFHGAFEAEDLERAGLSVGVFPVVCFEAFGLGLTECFELGLPAIVSDIGALPRRVGGGGLTVSPGDVEALAAAMVTLASDADARLALKAGIPPLPPEPEVHAAELATVYQEAASGARRRVPTVPATRRTRLVELQRESLAAELRSARGRQDPD